MKKYPTQFEYLKKVAKWCDPINSSQEAKKLVLRLEPKELDMFRVALRELIERNDIENLSDWIESISPEDLSKHDYSGLFRMHIMFDALADGGVSPFASLGFRFITRKSSKKKLDWSELPDELKYLIEPASKYGVYITETSIEARIKSAANIEIREISKLVDFIRMKNHETLIDQWVEKHKKKRPQEAKCMEGIMFICDMFS